MSLRDADFHDDLIAELARLHEVDVLRVIDALRLRKHADGQVEVRQVIEPAAGEAIDGACTWAALEELPNDSEAALVLIEHHWALRLHDVVASVGGFRVSDGFIISPLDVARMGRPSTERSDPICARPRPAGMT